MSKAHQSDSMETKLVPAARAIWKRVLCFAALGGYVFAGFIAIPVLTALVLFPDAPGLIGDALLVAGLVGLAALFHVQARRIPAVPA
ncbi:MAG: hypothetical protein OIF48_15610 [Silicimonas sp.]|nr:hypothetical protein [Silicimonas sp.]